MTGKEHTFKVLSPVLHNGVAYHPGDSIDLTAKEAARLSRVLAFDIPLAGMKGEETDGAASGQGENQSASPKAKK